MAIYFFKRLTTLTACIALIACSRAPAFEIRKESVGSILTPDEKTVLGTGFLVGTNNLPGRIITCDHLFFGQPGFEFIYRTWKGTDFKAVHRAGMPSYDIASLQITNDLPALKHGDFRRVRPGDLIHYVGWDSPSQMLTNRTAWVSAVGTAINGDRTVEFLEFHGQGRPGYSGGPVLNSGGEVIAIMREAWLTRGIRGGDQYLINRAISIDPMIYGDDYRPTTPFQAPK